jgi:DNA-binding NarL/FixJ family response regulator
MHANGVIRVLVIDSDARVRRALEQLIDAEEGMEVIAAAASAQDARVVLGRAPADVVLLDLLMPSVGAGLGLVGDLADAGYAVVATSLAGSARAAAMEAGATRFIEKGPDPAALLAAIRHSADPARCERPIRLESGVRCASRRESRAWRHRNHVQQGEVPCPF